MFSLKEVYVVDTRRSPYAKLISAPLNKIIINDMFWLPRIISLVERTLPLQYEFLEKTGRVDNFRVAAGLKEGGYTGVFWFNDSDVYKWIEASSYALIHKWRDDLYRNVNEVIEIIAKAQSKDGYLNTFIQLNKLERWENLAWSHELYCAGHLFQAAVAAKRALNNETLFKVAISFADLLTEVFGPEDNKLKTADGHPEIEMALVELYRESGNRKYLELAKFYVEIRGRGLVAQTNKNMFLRILMNPVYLVDHAPIYSLEEFAGSHAVRALYFFSGVTDLYMEIGDQRLWTSLQKLWNKTMKKIYVTGGLGARYDGESFGEDFELPNERAYSETCAAVAGIMWAWRMFLVTPSAEYMDMLEKVLYNAALAGISLDGSRYFYVNPLADYHARHERQPWYECACCPPNIARLLAYLPSIAYAISKDEPKIWINLFINSKAEIDLHGNKVGIETITEYPWRGDIALKVYPERSDEFSLMIRIPSWTIYPRIKIDGKVFEPVPGTYFEIMKKWDIGDHVEIYLPIKPRLVRAHPWIESDYNKLAIARGPLIYCIEQKDNENFDIRDLFIKPSEVDLREEYVPGLLNGVVVLKGNGYVLRNRGDRLYREHALSEAEEIFEKTTFTAIPYYAWNNRGPTRMSVLDKNN
ncbi:MAG: glycoside hydrolase family 127 protein [Desulfurococcaceae archaeon]